MHFSVPTAKARGLGALQPGGWGGGGSRVDMSQGPPTIRKYRDTHRVSGCHLPHVIWITHVSGGKCDANPLDTAHLLQQCHAAEDIVFARRVLHFDR